MSSYKSTYYQVLGLKPGVSGLEIKRAYRHLVKKYHPDVDRTANENAKAHERMARLNEAYETLKDKSKRAAYDASISTNIKGIILHTLDSSQIRQQYLNQVFNPCSKKISRVLSKYKNQLSNLSQDIYDQDLVAEMENYSHQIELVLATASQVMSKNKAPESLAAAELMLRYSIAQAADGLEEIQYFCGNYDYNHLITAGNLFRESNKLSRQALSLSKR